MHDICAIKNSAKHADVVSFVSDLMAEMTTPPPRVNKRRNVSPLHALNEPMIIV